MILKRIELENFLSFGKPGVELTFTDDEPLWALCGPNGVGKSAVFDGITYALYGQHRGGSQKAEQLIRHGADGFRIVLEFEFAGAEYRITRTRVGRTTQKVEVCVDGQWQAITGLNSAPAVKTWVERTLGLGYETFTTSVLLRQGEAEKLFSASRDERIAVLKGIIGFERFEDVSRRVHEETLLCGNTLDSLRRQIGALSPVSPEELSAAHDAVTAAEQKREDAQTDLNTAVQRVEHARQWQALDAKRAAIERQLAAADQRANDATAIRADKARLEELAVVPDLQSLVSLRDAITGLEPKITEAETVKDETTAAIEAKLNAVNQARQKEANHRQQAAELDRQAGELGTEIERAKKLLQLTTTMEEISAKLAKYPSDLADQLVQVEAKEKSADDEKQSASDDLAAAAALLKEAKDRRDRFADVQVGVTCSQCGQLVDEAHAAKERTRLNNEIQTHQSEVQRLTSVLAAAKAAATAARNQRVALQKDKREFDQQSAKLDATCASLTQLGAVADAAELRARIAEHQKQKLRAEQGAANERTKQKEFAEEALRLDSEHKALDTHLQGATDTIRKLELDLAGKRAAYNEKLARLTPSWQSQLATLDAQAVRQLAVERENLLASDVASRFELLHRDEEKRAEWSKQLNDVRADIDIIPADARVPPPRAQHRQQEAQRVLQAATRARDTAVQVRDNLQSKAQHYDRLVTDLRDAERRHDLHRKLDTLLGQTGLQRELVRDAEQQIVELANDTLHNLSGGELSLEPDDEASGRDDRAFALRARRAGDPQPIGVLFLSGSQKFRVAVSIALAVGRFASGRARPVEAVIIDEGFGSLDKDGLRAMADELKRLQRQQSLRRVILVSHQDEFTDQFSVGYRLGTGDNGAIAAPFRR